MMENTIPNPAVVPNEDPDKITEQISEQNRKNAELFEHEMTEVLLKLKGEFLKVSEANRCEAAEALESINTDIPVFSEPEVCCAAFSGTIPDTGIPEIPERVTVEQSRPFDALPEVNLPKFPQEEKTVELTAVPAVLPAAELPDTTLKATEKTAGTVFPVLPETVCPALPETMPVLSIADNTVSLPDAAVPCCPALPSLTVKPFPAADASAQTFPMPCIPDAGTVKVEFTPAALTLPQADAEAAALFEQMLSCASANQKKPVPTAVPDTVEIPSFAGISSGLRPVTTSPIVISAPTQTVPKVPEIASAVLSEIKVNVVRAEAVSFPTPAVISRVRPEEPDLSALPPMPSCEAFLADILQNAH